MILLPLKKISRSDHGLVGGKSFSLAKLATAGHRVPRTICVSTKAYKDFINATGLQEKIQLELNRKPFTSMRWEEIWDAALRIRNMFLRTPINPNTENILQNTIKDFFGNKPLAVRSSAPEEDSAGTSFAGLHQSFINIQGIQEIIRHIKLVWASLWSDAALLYRQELGLDVQKSSMAVVLQELVSGDCSGIMFTVNPAQEKQMVIESVHGLTRRLWMVLSSLAVGRLTKRPA